MMTEATGQITNHVEGTALVPKLFTVKDGVHLLADLRTPVMVMSLLVAVHEQTKTNNVVRALCVVISLSQQCGAALLCY